MNYLEVRKGECLIPMHLKTLGRGEEWGFGVVYGEVGEGSKERFWEEMTSIKSGWEVLWVLGRDFNTIRFLEERVSCRVFSEAMEEFSEYIDNQCLIDLLLIGENFTWTRARDSVSKSRLDKFLVSTDWEEMFPDVLQVPLPRLTSNYSPILLDGSRRRSLCILFRFENMWLKAPYFVDTTNVWWNKYKVVGTPSLRLACKLKMLKGDIRKWSKEVFRRVEVKMRELIN